MYGLNHVKYAKYYQIIIQKALGSVFFPNEALLNRVLLQCIKAALCLSLGWFPHTCPLIPPAKIPYQSSPKSPRFPKPHYHSNLLFNFAFTICIWSLHLKFAFEICIWFIYIFLIFFICCAYDEIWWISSKTDV